MSRHILVPVDGSQHALVAVDIAAELAGGENDTMTLMHVANHGRVPDGLKRFMDTEHIEGPVEWQYEQLVSNSILREAKERAESHGAAVAATIAKDGNAAEKIVEAAVEQHASMIVMGNRGLGAIKGLVYGGVSQKVNHLADCMVVTVEDERFI